MIQNVIAGAIKYWREVRDLSQRELAERTGLHYVHIARLELGQGNPTVSTLETLAETLRIDVVDLFTVPKAKRPARKRARGKR